MERVKSIRIAKFAKKNEIVEFFMSIKDKVRIEDLTFYE